MGRTGTLRVGAARGVQAAAVTLGNRVLQERASPISAPDPASPVLRGSVDLPETVWPGYGMWYWGWGDEVVQVNGSTLAFHRYPYGFRYYDCLACAGPGGLDAVAPPLDPVLPDHTIRYFFDFVL